MYTTLNHLKDAGACKEGFSKLLAFFGTSTTIKDKRIPLHAVLLISGKNDFEWAVNHGCVIEEEQFNALLDRVLPGLIRYAMKEDYDWKRVMRKENISNTGQLVVDQLKTVKTHADLKAVVHTMQFKRSGDNALWGDMLEKISGWLNPADMLDTLADVHHRLNLDLDLPYYDTKLTAEERLARVLANGDPFTFLEEFPPKTSTGSSFVKTGNTFSVNLNNMSPQKLFYLMRSVNLKSAESTIEVGEGLQAVLVEATEAWNLAPTAMETRTDEGEGSDDEEDDDEQPRHPGRRRDRVNGHHTA